MCMSQLALLNEMQLCAARLRKPSPARRAVDSRNFAIETPSLGCYYPMSIFPGRSFNEGIQLREAGFAKWLKEYAPGPLDGSDRGIAQAALDRSPLLEDGEWEYVDTPGQVRSNYPHLHIGGGKNIPYTCEVAYRGSNSLETLGMGSRFRPGDSRHRCAGGVSSAEILQHEAIGLNSTV